MNSNKMSNKRTRYSRNVWRPVPRPTDDKMPRPTQ